jgi:hypothetical protein
MAEAVLLPLVAGALLLAGIAVRERPAGRRGVAVLGALGAVLALAALTRSEAVLLVPAVAVPVALVAGPGDARARLRRLAAVLLPVVILLGAWTVRTVTRLDAVVPLTTNSGTLLAGANCDEVFRGPRTGQWSLRCATESLPDPITDEAAASVSMRRAGLRYAGGHADRLPAVATVRVLRTFGVWDIGDARQGKRTAIDIVIEFGRKRDAAEAEDHHPDDATASDRHSLRLSGGQSGSQVRSAADHAIRSHAPDYATNE